METVYARIKASGKVLITFNEEAYDTVLGFHGISRSFTKAQSLGSSIGNHMPCTSTLTAHYARP